MRSIRFALFPLVALIATLCAPAHSYTPRITKADIVAGFGKCAGNLCTINGRTYDCSGGGNCTSISLR